MEELTRITPMPKVIDEFDVAALMIYSNIDISHWRKVVQCLKMFMGVEQVAVNETKWRELGADHGTVYSLSYMYEKKGETGGGKKGGKTIKNGRSAYHTGGRTPSTNLNATSPR